MSAGGEETRNGIITVSINYSMKMELFKTLVVSVFPECFGRGF